MSKHNRTYSQYFVTNEAFSNVHTLVHQLQNSSDPAFLSQTIDDIQSILSQDYPPYTKILAIKLIKEIFLLSKESLITLIEKKILLEVVAVVMFQDNLNGAAFFAETNYYRSADQRQKEDFRVQGVEYVGLCKDSVMAWANLVPFTNDGHPSKFSEKYNELVKRGVVFSKNKVLYRENDKETFAKSYKVQFFNEDSSMSDSFLTESNCVNQIEKELSQCDQLEDSLKSTLKPYENDTDWSTFKTIMERINIFFHESSVKMLQEIKSFNMPKQFTTRVLFYQSRFGQIAEDYEYLKSHKMRYVNFYELYGYKLTTPQKSQGRVGFSPAESVINSAAIQVNMRKNKVDASIPVEGYRQSFEPIALGGKRAKKMTSSIIQQPSNVMIEVSNPSNIYLEKKAQEDNDREMFEQKKQAEIEEFYKTKMRQDRQQAQFRINQLKKQMSNQSNNINLISQQELIKRVEQQSQPLNRKILELHQDLKQSQIEKQKLKSRNRQIQNQLSQTQRQYHEKDIALKKTLQDTERFKNMSNNYEEKIQYLQKQVQKESFANEKLAESNRVSQVSEMSTKKLEKKLENMIQEKDLLKQELANERSKKYQHTSNETKLLKQQIQRLKTKIKQKDVASKDTLIKMDLAQIDNIKLKQQLKIKATIVQSLKKENERMNLTLKQINSSDRKPEQTLQLAPSISQITSTRLDIKDYLEVGMQGLVYYDVLSRQFKVKYKRSCFKKKQLLYKQNNIEIGVITQVSSFNTISSTLFLTNYGTKNINKIRLKVLNPTSNQIELDTNYIESLNQGQQQKVYIESTLHQYPIGPVVLKLEHSGSNLEQTSQLLIPVSIIKLVRSITRHNPYLQQYNNIQIKYDHKMIQNATALKDYFPNVEFKIEGGNAVLRMTMIHDQTKTEWDMDLEIDGDYLNVRWGQVRSGYQEIQGYYCKTLWNLLSK